MVKKVLMLAEKIKKVHTLAEAIKRVFTLAEKMISQLKVVSLMKMEIL